MRKWEEDILYLSDYKVAEEISLRRMDVYSFYFMLADQHRRNNKESLSENFGVQR